MFHTLFTRLTYTVFIPIDAQYTNRKARWQVYGYIAYEFNKSLASIYFVKIENIYS